MRCSDPRLYADETCDASCRWVGRDGIHRCADAIIEANPDGLSPEAIGFYQGITTQGVEWQLRRIIDRIVSDRSRARLARETRYTWTKNRINVAIARAKRA